MLKAVWPPHGGTLSISQRGGRQSWEMEGPEERFLNLLGEVGHVSGLLDY